MYETLVTKEEMAKSEDLGDYYRISADNRDLNYDKYFSKGDNSIIKEEYNSDNTNRLNVAQMKELLLKLPKVRQDLGL
jgi:UDP-glucose 4-epimerase